VAADRAGAAAADGAFEAELARAGVLLGARLVEAVPGWVIRETDRILDAWAATAAGAGLDRVTLGGETAEAARQAADDVAVRLASLLAADMDAQATTPLEIIRGAVSYPTAVLRRAGVPAVVRDDFDERRFPDDLYGLTPASLAALDPALADPARAWGAAKAMAHRARHRRSSP
jgi:hypothetical protein